MEPPVNKALKNLLNQTLSTLEERLGSDVLTYYGPLYDGNENEFLEIVEDLAKDVNRREQLAVVLTTNGGSPTAVERYVNIIRKLYARVIFVVPDYVFRTIPVQCSGDTRSLFGC